jgi:hypothetical protein
LLIRKEGARMFVQRVLVVRHAEGCHIAAVLTAIAGQDYLLNDLEIGWAIGSVSV